MDPRTRYLASTRSFRTNADDVTQEEPGGPVGAQTSTSVQDEINKFALPMHERRRRAMGAGTQAHALRGVGGLTEEGAEQVGGAYQAGGFDTVKQIEGWYDLPSWQRTQILAGATGRG